MKVKWEYMRQDGRDQAWALRTRKQRKKGQKATLEYNAPRKEPKQD